MIRNVSKLKEENFDLCIIGGGIYGACVARDAILRGLSVALIEKGDFGHATTFNFQKTIHGGFRYLQNFNLPRVISAAKERQTWMKIAPHQVHLMPFLVPTTKKITRSKPAFFAAFLAYYLLTLGSKSSKDPQKKLPFGKLLSLEECNTLFPMFNHNDITGGALFNDGFVHNSERLVFSIIKSSFDAGAHIANYARAKGLLMKGNQVIGVKAQDVINDEDFIVKAKVVINATGPWVNKVNKEFNCNLSEDVGFLKVWYLMLEKPKLQCAVGLPAENGKHFFMLPWHGKTLIGAAEAIPDKEDYERIFFSNNDVDKFLNDVNKNYPKINLKGENVLAIRGGIVPIDRKSVEKGDPGLSEKTKIIDHADEENIKGLISVASVKFTMARKVAQQIVDQALNKLGKKHTASITDRVSVYGGNIDDFSNYLQSAIINCQGLIDAETVQHLVRNHGTAYENLLDVIKDDKSLGERISKNTPVIKAEIVHAARTEMVVNFSDIVFRRTEIGIKGNPGYETLYQCSVLVARELNWSEERRVKELDDVWEMFKEPQWGGHKCDQSSSIEQAEILNKPPSKHGNY